MAIYDARAWIEVDLDAVRANYDTVRRAVGDGVAMVPMVKADAYGLGVQRVLRVLEPLGPWGYGVATAKEGAELRSLGITRPVLIAGPLPAGHVDLAARTKLTASISSVEGLERWAAAAERVGQVLDFHVDVDTGMGRSGFDWRDAYGWSRELTERAGSRVRWTGVFTHFHSADEEDPSSVRAQWERFRGVLVQLPMAPDTLMVHAGNSAASLRWSEYAGDAVRPGIFLYGGRAGEEGTGLPEPEPVVSVRSRLVLVRDATPGSTLGYGATHVARTRERWGTVSIGYGDGLPRALGNRGHALVRGRRVPITGRISMDMTTVILDDVQGVAVGDVVTLIGRDGAERITVDEVAARVGTISYEVLVSVGVSRLPRVERTQAEAERA